MRRVAFRFLLRAFRLLPVGLARFLVRHSGPQFTLGVQVIVRRRNGEVLLVQQTYRELPFLPGGTMKFGESILACARRELREETGLVLDCAPLGMAQVRARGRWVTFYALAEADEAQAAAARACSPEIQAITWAHPDRLPAVDPGVVAAFRHVRSAPRVLE